MCGLCTFGTGWGKTVAVCEEADMQGRRRTIDRNLNKLSGFLMFASVALAHSVFTMFPQIPRRACHECFVLAQLMR